VLSYRVILDVPLPLVLFVSGLLAEHRRELGTRSGTRAPSCWKQAVFALAWFRDRPDIRRLAPSCLAKRDLERPEVEGVAGGPPERLGHSGPPVAERGVGEKAGEVIRERGLCRPCLVRCLAMGQPATAGTVSASFLTNQIISDIFYREGSSFLCGGRRRQRCQCRRLRKASRFTGLAAVPSACDRRRCAPMVGRCIERDRGVLRPPGLERGTSDEEGGAPQRPRSKRETPDEHNWRQSTAHADTAWTLDRRSSCVGHRRNRSRVGVGQHARAGQQWKRPRTPAIRLGQAIQPMVGAPDRNGIGERRARLVPV
jgi:hypothetical protein